MNPTLNAMKPAMSIRFYHFDQLQKSNYIILRIYQYQTVIPKIDRINILTIICLIEIYKLFNIYI